MTAFLDRVGYPTLKAEGEKDLKTIARTVRLAMQGRINCGRTVTNVPIAGGMIIIQDPLISPQSIIIPMAGDAVAANLFQAGWWVAIGDLEFTMHFLASSPPTDVSFSYAIIG